MRTSCQKLDLVQGSEEWLRPRSKYPTASDMASIMGVKGAYSTWEKVLKEKLQGPAPVNPFLQRKFDRGHEAEKALRTVASQALGMNLEPAVYLNESLPLFASLDGVNESAGIIVEMKLSEKKEILECVKDGVCWEPFRVQSNAQMLASGFTTAYLLVLDGEGHSFLLSVEPDLELQELIKHAAHAFYGALKNGRVNEAFVSDARMHTLAKLLNVKRDIEMELKEPLKLLEQTEKEIDTLKKQIAEDFNESVIENDQVIITKSKPSERLDRASLEASGFDLRPFLKLEKPRVTVKLKEKA